MARDSRAHSRSAGPRGADGRNATRSHPCARQARKSDCASSARTSHRRKRSGTLKTVRLFPIQRTRQLADLRRSPAIGCRSDCADSRGSHPCSAASAPDSNTGRRASRCRREAPHDPQAPWRPRASWVPRRSPPEMRRRRTHRRLRCLSPAGNRKVRTPVLL